MNEFVDNGFVADDDDWDISFTEEELADNEAESEVTADENVDQQNESETEQTEETPAEDTAAETDQFLLKHLGEEKSVNRDEVITLAQKGMDYDRIHGKYDEMTKENASLKEQMSDYENVKDKLGYFEEIAKASGMTLDELLVQTLAAQAAAKNGTSIDAEAPSVRLNLERKAFEKQKSNWEKANSASSAKAEDDRKAQISADLKQFAEEFPDAAKDIEHNVPQEVWDAVNKGNTTLTAEFRKYANRQMKAENESLKSQLEQAKQNEKNKQRSTGSQSSGSVATTGDMWDNAWNSDD